MQLQFHQDNPTSQHLPNYQQPLQQQNLMNLNSFNQKGAFIPLQVSRGIKTLSIETQTPSTSANKQSNSLSNNDIIVQNVCQK